MQITIRKLTDADLLRRANSFTTSRESHMDLLTAYRLRHSPIRTQLYWIEMRDIPLFVASQLVRSHVGIQCFQKSHRPDRNKDAKDKGRMTPTDLAMLINADAIMNMSAKRLCSKASPETRETWQQTLELIEETDPDLVKYCKRSCVQSGVCRERKPCGYMETVGYQSQRQQFKNLFNTSENK